MDNTYVMFDAAFLQQAKVIAERLGAKTISYIAYERESETHDWLTREFELNSIERLIIPLSILSNDTEGLLIALHIRLNYELPITKRTIPIIIISNLSIENILTKSNFDLDNNPQNLLFSQGISVSSTDIDEIKEKIEETTPLCSDEYPKFLKSLSINRKALSGHHDMANAWGCYKLSQVVGYKLSSPKIKDYLGQMYAKWLICTNNAFASTDNSFAVSTPIACKGKRILYIDDKADEGWGELMQFIFRDAGDGFVYVNPSKFKTPGFDYNSFQKECESYIGQKWDLILIDLRLNPDVEDIDSSDIIPTELSGYKLIDAFLGYNAGYQIIVFTASNKIWNVDAAIQRGARGYYIKESPIFYQTKEESIDGYEKNFKTIVNKCFRNSYLYDIDDKITELWNSLPQNQLGKEIYKQLDIAFELIRSARLEEQYAYAYISLYLVIEVITSYCITKEEIISLSGTNDKYYKWKLDNGEYIKDYKWDSSIKAYQSIGDAKIFGEKTPFPQWKQIAGLVLQKWNVPNGSHLVRECSFLIEKRNGFVHNDQEILEKEKKGKKVNHDIYDERGFVKLFYVIIKICSYL